MDRKTLQGYRKDKRELALLDKTLEKLQERLENVPVVSGKVTKSGDDFPYIEEHVTILMQEPKEATELKRRIREKELRREVVLGKMKAVETWIAGMQEGNTKRIFEMYFLEGMCQEDIGNAVGYTKGRISQIISKKSS